MALEMINDASHFPIRIYQKWLIGYNDSHIHILLWTREQTHFSRQCLNCGTFLFQYSTDSYRMPQSKRIPIELLLQCIRFYSIEYTILLMKCSHLHMRYTYFDYHEFAMYFLLDIEIYIIGHRIGWVTFMSMNTEFLFEIIIMSISINICFECHNVVGNHVVFQRDAHFIWFEQFIKYLIKLKI